MFISSVRWDVNKSGVERFSLFSLLILLIQIPSTLVGVV